SERGKSDDIDNIIFLHFIVVFFVIESKCEHTLFLQVGFMDTSEALYDDCAYTQMSGFHSGMFSGATFAVDFITDYYAAETGSFINALNFWNLIIFSGQLVFYLIAFHIESIDGANQHIVRDIIEVTSVFQPWTSHGDMVSSTFSVGFNQQFQTCKISAFPSRE